MKMLYDDPELQLLVWRSDERALLARLEIRRQLGPRHSELAPLGAAMLGSVGALLIRCGQWLTEPRDAARSLNVSGQIRPTS